METCCKFRNDGPKQRDIVGKNIEVDYFQIKEEDFGIQRYFHEMTLNNATIYLSYISEMFKYGKLNFSNDPVFSQQRYICDECDSLSSNVHLTWCSGYSKYRRNINILENNSALVKYFQQIIEHRKQADSRLE